MKRLSYLQQSAAWSLVALSPLSGCSTSEKAPQAASTESTAENRAAVLGGVPSPDWRAVVKIGDCTGTVIGPRQVLTAGHCVGGPGWTTTIVVSDASGTIQTATGIQAYPFHAQDAAVVIADVDLKATPIPVYSEPMNAGDWVGRKVLVVGFGSSGDGGAKQAAWMPINFFYGDGRGYDVGDASSSICPDDSGGPHFAALGGRWYVVGLNKVQSSCGGTPPVFTDSGPPTPLFGAALRADVFSSFARALATVRGDHVGGPRSPNDTWAKGNVDNDANHREDFVVTTLNGTFLYLGAASGWSIPWSNPAWKLGSVDTALGDFDGDGKADLAVLTTSSFNIYLSTGSGFSASPWATNGWRLGTVNLSIGDFNGDGKADVLGLGVDTGYLLPSTGSGLGAGVNLGAGKRLSEATAVVADYDGDGKADALIQTAATNENVAEARLWLGGGTAGAGGTLTDSGWANEAWARGKVQIVPGRFTSTGSNGRAVLISDKNGAKLYPSLAPTAGFAAVESWSTTGFWQANRHQFTVGQFGSTVHDDILVTNETGSFLYLSNGTDSPWSTAAWVRSDLTTLNTTYVPGDFSGDGLSDLWIINPSGAFRYQASGGTLSADGWSDSALKFQSFFAR